ncbi:MAG: nucleotidyltransferase domain-containing protein [Anaerolineae bacterium]
MAYSESDKVFHYFLQEIKYRLGHHLKELILFGSRARGDDIPGSDYDCLAIVDEISPEINNIIDELAGELLFRYNAVFSVIPISEPLYLQATLDPFLINIREEGITL